MLELTSLYESEWVQVFQSVKVAVCPEQHPLQVSNRFCMNSIEVILFLFILCHLDIITTLFKLLKYLAPMGMLRWCSFHETQINYCLLLSPGNT